MKAKIQNFIPNAAYTYDNREFMPIYKYGKLENRSEFVAYKAKRVLNVMVEHFLK